MFAIRIDCSDSRSIREAFEGVLSLGFVEVLVYNAYQPIPPLPTNFADIRIDAFEKSLAVSSVGAFHCAQQVLVLLIRLYIFARSDGSSEVLDNGFGIGTRKQSGVSNDS